MPIEVDFYEISETRSVLSEAEELMTNIQLARLRKCIGRLEQHGWALNGDYFDRVRDTKEKLHEYRLSLDRVEFRFLFADESGTFVMLAVYKEKRNAIPDGSIKSAEIRLAAWRRKKDENQRLAQRQDSERR